MEDRTKAQITIGFLAFFASMWILIQETLKSYENPLYIAGLLLILLVVMLLLSYIIISILEWINVFDLKTNAILALVVLTTFMITFTVYLLTNSTS
jgi:hypothetical protein